MGRNSQISSSEGTSHIFPLLRAVGLRPFSSVLPSSNHENSEGHPPTYTPPQGSKSVMHRHSTSVFQLRPRWEATSAYPSEQQMLGHQWAAKFILYPNFKKVKGNLLHSPFFCNSGRGCEKAFQRSWGHLCALYETDWSGQSLGHRVPHLLADSSDQTETTSVRDNECQRQRVTETTSDRDNE